MEELKMILLMVGFLAVALAALEVWKWSSYDRQDDWTDRTKEKR